MLRRFLSFITLLSSLSAGGNLVLAADVRPFLGKSHLSLPNGIRLSVVTNKDFDLVDEQGARRYWKTTVSLKRKGKLLWQEVYREFNEMKWVWGDFVPIRNGKYFADLNGDGLHEVAILPWDFGMAVYRAVEIYTVKGEDLVKYGEGKYHFEQGPNVLLGCPKCWMFDLKACGLCS